MRGSLKRENHLGVQSEIRNRIEANGGNDEGSRHDGGHVRRRRNDQ